MLKGFFKEDYLLEEEARCLPYLHMYGVASVCLSWKRIILDDEGRIE